MSFDEINPEAYLFKVTKEPVEGVRLSFDFESEELNLEGFYKWDGCFNYSAKDGEHNHMIHVCDVNRMILFLEKLKEAARERGYDD
jgi:hypothetical protein